MTDDVVALLDQWIAALKGHPAAWAGISYEDVERARDEILALREMREALIAINDETRNEALEEAALACDALYDGYSTATTDQTDPEQVWLDACDRAATRIRALKGKA